MSNVWSRIKELHIEKKKCFKILLLVELCLIVACIIGLFGKDDVYRYQGKDMAVNFGTYSEEMGGCYVDNSYGRVGDAVRLDSIALPKGVYTVTLCYDTDTFMKNMCYMEDGSGQYRSFLCNGEHLYAGLGETDFQIWVLTDKSDLSLMVDYGGEGSMVIRDLYITESNALYRMLLFWCIVIALLVNICVIYVQYDKAYGISVQDKNVTFGLVVVVLFASLPLMVDTMLSSGDLIYHLIRIVGIKDGLSAGQFPVRIAPEWQQGYGYASSIFYGETLVYIAALLRLIGFPLVTCYRMFLFLMNCLTVWISYTCFSKIFKDKYAGLLCSAVYSISIYRITKTFVCGSLGETLGNMFLPLLVYGFYRVFTQDINEKSYKRAWIPLTVGFTGLVQSHLLTGEQVGLFTIILCVILWKKVFRPKTFLVLAQTVIYTVLLSFWFLVPFADYMLRDDFVIQHVSGRTIQSRGLYLAHLFFTYFSHGTSVFFDNSGMADSQPMGIGIALWLPLLLFGIVLFVRKATVLEQGYLQLGKIGGAFALISMWMSLSVFPWDRIQSWSSITATLVSSIQFPNRFLTITTVCLTVLVGLMWKWVQGVWKEKGSALYFTTIVVMVFLSSVYLTNSIMVKTDNFQVYDEECIGSGYIAGAEYLPYETDASLLMHRGPIAEPNVIVEDYEKDGLYMQITCHNDSAAEGAVDLPLLYYRGYRAYDMATGEELPIAKGNNNVVCVAVQPGYNGTVEVMFVPPWYWRVAEIISVVTLIALCMSCCLQKKKEAKA